MYNKKAAIPTLFITAILALAIIPIPTGAVLLENVYYLNAVRNRYYAINTNGQSYRVFYISNGETIFVAAYKWDANQNYIIFQSPINGRVYLRQETYTLNTLNTIDWFPASVPTPTCTITASFPAPFTYTYTANVQFTLQSSSSHYSYNGQNVNHTEARIYTINNPVQTYTVTRYTTSGVSANSNYNIALTLTRNVNIQYYNATVQGKIVYYNRQFYENNKWMNSYIGGSGSVYYWYVVPLTYTHATMQTGNSQVSVTTGALDQLVLSLADLENAYTLTLKIVFPSTQIPFSVSNVKSKTNGLITADNGNVIQPIDSLSELQYASLYSTSASYNYHLQTQPINLTLNGTYPMARGQQTVTLNITANITAGDAIAPHLYDWSLQAGAYIRKNNPSIGGSIGGGTSPEFYVYAGSNLFQRDVGSGTPRIAFFWCSNGYYGRAYNAGGNELSTVHRPYTPDEYKRVSVPSSLNAWYYSLGWVNYTAMRVYVKNLVSGQQSSAIITGSSLGTANSMIIGSTDTNVNVYVGRISFAVVSRSNPVVSGLYTLTANNMYVFLDATFFNGTRYVDLSGYGNHGTPYGGVARIPADNKWLWHVKGLYSDGYVHFRFIPVGSLITVQRGNQTVFSYFVGEYNANDASMVEDIPVLLSNGTYTITITCITPETTEVTVQNQLLNQPVIIPMLNITVPANPKPAVHVPTYGTWHTTYYVADNPDEQFIIFIPPAVTANSLNIKLVWNYPIPYTLPQLNYRYARGAEVLNIIPTSGNVEINNTLVYIHGSLDLSPLLGHTLLLRVKSFDGFFTTNYTLISAVYSGAYNASASYIAMYVTAGTYFTGTMQIESCLILYNTKANTYCNAMLGDIALEAWEISRISYYVQGEIQGAWSYRLPIYVTLSELPQSLSEAGIIFRFVLPLRAWVSANMLSPAFEDLMFTDASMKPLPYYIADADAGIVYVKWDKPVTSSNIVIYVLLKNLNLWGSGNSYSSLTATFDLINPKDFTDDFGFNVFYSYLAYNLLVIKPKNETTIKIGKTWFDFVAVNNTKLIEQHGNTVFYTMDISLGLRNAKELTVYISRQDFHAVLIWTDGEPSISFNLADFNCTPAYYIGYRDVQALYAGRMVLYSYSIGDYQGGMQRPTQISKPAQASAAPTVDWFALFGMVFLLILISVAVRFVSSGMRSRREQSGVFP